MCSSNKPQGWMGQWGKWWDQAIPEPRRFRSRSVAIDCAVREAVAALSYVERMIIEGYYFDGYTLSSIGCTLNISTQRVQTVHRHALSRLRRRLAPFVEKTFRIGLTTDPECTICSAPWRRIAEDILDEKTPETTWGQIAVRLHRAVGWYPSTPQVLIGHQKSHRVFASEFTRDNSIFNPFDPLED